jgi:NADP-dependent 3-hydroxy acid dehydrogenase YdfG
MDRAVDAFRFMAQAKHIGKLVITQPAATATSPAIRSDRTYLITGGYGALGLTVARWLRDRGARHIALAGRKGPDAATSAAIATLAGDQASIRVVQGDVSDDSDVARMLSEIAR